MFVCLFVCSAVVGRWSAVVYARLELSTRPRRVWRLLGTVHARSMSHRCVVVAAVLSMISVLRRSSITVSTVTALARTVVLFVAQIALLCPIKTHQNCYDNNFYEN